MIVVILGTAAEVKRWALEHNLVENKDFIRVRHPKTLRSFLPGTEYATVGEWARVFPSYEKAGYCFVTVRKGSQEMLNAAECAGLRLRKDLAE